MPPGDKSQEQQEYDPTQGTNTTSQPYSQGLKADMVRVWLAGKTV